MEDPEGLPDYWKTADSIADVRSIDPPSERHRLVERVAWGMHAARGLESPRKEWAEMADGPRVELLLQAAGAIAAYERYAPELS